MSYEPLLLIRKSDLEKNRDKIIAKTQELQGKIGVKASNQQIIRCAAYEEICKALDKEAVKFKEIIQPELSSHNNNVRMILADLNIDYRTSF